MLTAPMPISRTLRHNQIFYLGESKEAAEIKSFQKDIPTVQKTKQIFQGSVNRLSWLHHSSCLDKSLFLSNDFKPQDSA